MRWLRNARATGELVKSLTSNTACVLCINLDLEYLLHKLFSPRTAGRLSIMHDGD